MFFVFGKKLWEIMEISFHLVSVLFLGLFGLRIRLIWPPYQADMAPYQANTHRYQAVPWRRETTLILTMQSYEIYRRLSNNIAKKARKKTRW
jgi:hypothetical protein